MFDFTTETWGWVSLSCSSSLRFVGCDITFSATNIHSAPPTPPLTPPITLSPSHSDSLFITATGVTQESVCDYRFCRSLFLGWALRSASVFSSARRPVRWACCSKTNQQMCVTPHLSQIGTTSGATGHALAESDWTHSAFYFVARDSGVKDGESGATVE